MQAVQSQSSNGSLGRRGSSLMRIPTRDPNAPNGIHPEIQQVVGLTLAHSSKVYCSGPLVRRSERNPDGTTSKDARWVDVWAQLGGTTLSVWDMEAIKKASEEGREEPPAYINVTDSVSIPI
jgi:CCR4-NOT transcriptional complex subunit CAF120